jgi:hypothetical protein
MSVTAVAVGLCAIVIVALSWLVGSLHGQLRRLAAQIAEMADARRDAAVPAPEATAREHDRPFVTARGVAVVADVPVITAMPEADDADLTARRVVSVTLARPLIKVAALSYGIRRALDDENRFKVRYAMRRELRRQRKMRRRRRAGRAPSMERRR